MASKRLCDLAPDGRTMELNGALGLFGGAAASLAVVFDYHTGQASLVFSGGLGVSGAAAQIGVSSGFIFGAGNSVPSYMSGGNTSISASLPGGVGVSVTTNSGGITGNPTQLAPASATAVQIGYAAGLVSLLGGFGATTQNTISSVSLGSFRTGPAAIFASPIDSALTAVQQGCP